MTGRAVFEKITDISDKFLEEAAFVPETGTVVKKRRRERSIGGFSRFMNSGWGVAMVCCLVAIGTIVGMVMWGRMGGPVKMPPATTVGGTWDWYETDDDISTNLTTELSEKAIINQAKIIIMQRTGMTDLSVYQVSATRDDNGDWNLEFRIYIQGYPTTDVIRLKLAPCGKEIDYHKNFGYISKFSLYMPHVTEEMVDKAVAKLGDVDKSDLFWQIDSQGYLCIGYEVVHDSVDCVVIDMVNERVCPKPE